MESTDESLKVDSDGFATCPNCGERINCGTVGISIIVKRHRGSKKCKLAQEARDRKGKEKEQTSIFTFLQPKPVPVPSTIASTYHIGGRNQTVITVNQDAILPDKPGPVLRPQNTGAAAPTGSKFITRLKAMVENIPDHVPEGLGEDRLAKFAGDPRMYDNPSIDGDSLWEEVLNPFLKTTLGWGMEDDMQDVVRRGGKGMDGLLRFVEYFTEERGVSEGLFEGKLAHLLDTVEKMLSTSNGAIDSPSAPMPASSSHQSPHERADNIPQVPNPVIDVDCFEVPVNAVDQSPLPPDNKCQGYILHFPAGQSPYSAYPFALHDVFPLPWDFVIKEGVMTLFARNCTGSPTGRKASCQLCLALPKNKFLEGILTRLTDGIHQNAKFAFYGFDGLVELLRRKNQQIEFYRLRGLNQAKTLLGKATALTDYKRFIVAISSGKVQRVHHLIRIQLRQKKGIRGIMSAFKAAADGTYHPKSYTEEEDMYGLLLFRLAGNRAAQINHRSGHAPSVTYLKSRSIMPLIIPSPGKPTALEVQKNVEATFEGLWDVIEARVRVQHVILMFDEVATEKRLRWDPKTNNFIGLCRQHSHKTSLEFINEGDMEEVFRALDNGEVHYAPEATIGALGILCKDNRIYPGRAVLVSGDCKRETGEQHSGVIQTVISGVDSQRQKTKLRIVSLASDGESRRGAAFILLTFKRELSFESPIYPLISPLGFMDLHVGDDDLTCDKDWKHIFKRFRNLLLRARGVVVTGFRITPDITRVHFKSNGLSVDHVRSLFNPEDQQDVKLAFNMLKDIWSLPEAPDNSGPGFKSARDALRILGKALFYLVFPFLCVDLSLSEQLEHLAAAAHLVMVLYKMAGKEFIPTNLYIDIMLMIKNVFFCVAKAKVNDPDCEFWIILLGTDRLEELFGVLRTIVGNDANLDLLSLVARLSGSTEVMNILAKYPEWDRTPRRLKLPAITRDSKELPDSCDHIKPGSWRGDVYVRNVSLQTSWKRGRHLVENNCSFSVPILQKLDQTPGISILSPFANLLVSIPLPDDDTDESQEDIRPSSIIEIARGDLEVTDAEARIEVEDELNLLSSEDAAASKLVLSRQPISTTISIKGKEMSKARALSQFSKFRKISSSTDRLKRVQQVERYSARDVVPVLRAQGGPESDELILVPSDPIASLLCSDNRVWLCIGEVNGLKVDGKAVDYLTLDMLTEQTVSVSYQVLGLRPTTSIEDPTMKHDWRSYIMEEHSYTVPGRLIQVINPSLSTINPHKPFYLLESSVLVTLAASLFEYLAASDLKTIPKLVPTNDFPYREASGKSCFICEDDQNLVNIGNINIVNCSACGPDITLDLSQPQRVLEHMAAHILHDPKVERSIERCGFCLRPSPLCEYYLKKGKGAQTTPTIDRTKSRGCPMVNIKFSYGVAAESTSSSPCTNVPKSCPLCPNLKPAIWSYSFKIHFQTTHEKVDFKKYQYLWEISNFETAEMKKIWGKRLHVSVRRPKKSQLPPLVVSETHRATVPSTDEVMAARERELFDQAVESVVDSESEREGGNEAEMQAGNEEEVSIASGSNGDKMVEEDDGSGAEVQAVNEEEGRIASGSNGDKTVEEASAVRNPKPISESVDNAIMLSELTEHVNDRASTDKSPHASTIPGRSEETLQDMISDESTGRPKRKRIVVEMDDLNLCLCGTTANPTSSGVLQCKHPLCETLWYHLECVQLDYVPAKWVCKPCRQQQAGRGGKAQRR